MGVLVTLTRQPPAVEPLDSEDVAIFIPAHVALIVEVFAAQQASQQRPLRPLMTAHVRHGFDVDIADAIIEHHAQAWQPVHVAILQVDSATANFPHMRCACCSRIMRFAGPGGQASARLHHDQLQRICTCACAIASSQQAIAIAVAIVRVSERACKGWKPFFGTATLVLGIGHVTPQQRLGARCCERLAMVESRLDLGVHVRNGQRPGRDLGIDSVQ